MLTRRWGRARTRPDVLRYLIALLLVMPGPTLAASPSVAIGEVNWAGSSRSTADEWIELWNLGSQDQSLNGWRLEGASATPLVFNKTSIIPSQQALLIANYDETSSKSVLNVHPAIVTADISLGNDGLALRLSNDQGLLVDQVGDGQKPFAGDTKPPASMIRSNLDTDIPPPAAWKTADTAQNLDTGVGDRGTPGFCDGCHTTVSSTRSEPPPIPATSSTSPEVEAATSTPLKIDTATSTSASAVSSTAPIITLSETTSTLTFATTTSPLSSTSTKADLKTVPASSFTTSTSEPSSATTTTFAASSTLAIPTTSETSTAAMTASSTQMYTSSSGAVTAATIQNQTPTTCRARLEAIFPAPSSGPEWIEVSGCDTAQMLAGWSIHDSQGLILTIASLTAIESPNESIFRIPLPGQHLNNGGDIVMLRGPDGGLYDIITYPSLKHDERHARRSDNTWWIPERAPTPAAPNAPPQIAPTSEPSIVLISAQSATPQHKNEQSAPSTAPVKTTVLSSSSKTVRAASVTSVALGDYLASKNTKEPAPVRANKKSPKPKRLSSSSMTSSPQAPRVTLHGIVGTPPNLIAKRRFVLLNTTGKGVLIHTNNLQPSPTLGQRINITGSLITNDDGTHLEMRTRDRWQASQITINDPKPISLQALADDVEPSWSLAEVRGVVESRSGNSVHLTVGDDEVIAVISPSLEYRSARLAPGDELRLSGLLDTGSHPARLYPRAISDITIVKQMHAPITGVASNTHDSLPPWIPVGAAGATVAAGYGLRRLRKWYEEKRLAQQLSSALEQLSSTS